MKHKIVKIMAGILCAAFCVGSGYFMGRNVEPATSPVITEKITETVKQSGPAGQTTAAQTHSTIVAIVNMDEGIISGDTVTNYGNVLTNNLAIDKRITGLEDARQGIENGTYGAYIIIPNGFSGNVNTLSSQPQRTVLSYAIGKNIKGQSREIVINNISQIYNSFSDNLSQVYTSSILKEFHDIQDSAYDIMSRDTEDMEMLASVSGHNLIELIKAPELKQVENTVKQPDLHENYELAKAGIKNLDDSYKSYVEEGQHAFEDIQNDSETMKEIYATDTRDKLNTVSREADGIVVDRPDNADLETEEKALYEEQKNALVGNVEEGDAADGILTAYNRNITAFNTSLITQIGQYEHIESQYRAFLDSLDSFDSGVSGMVVGEYTTPDGNIEQIGMTQREYQLYSQQDIDTMCDAITGLLEQQGILATEEIEDIAQAVEGIKPKGLLVAGNFTDVSAPQIIVDGNVKTTVDQIDINGENGVTKKIDTIISKADSARTTRESQLDSQRADYENKNDTIREKLGALDSVYSTQESMQNELIKKGRNFNLFSFINNDEISSVKESLNINNQDITDKLEDYEEKSSDLIDDVYETTTENIKSMQESIAEGQEKSEKKLEEGLAAAKESRENNNTTNVEILKNFSTRLPYTRLGALENKDVYEFIANPLIVDNQSEDAYAVETKTASVLPTVKNENTESIADETSALPWIYIAAPTAAMILALIILLIAKACRANKKEDF